MRVSHGFGERWNLFQGTKGYLSIYLRNQGISVLLNGTLTKHFREEKKFIDEEQGRRSDIYKGSRENARLAIGKETFYCSSPWKKQITVLNKFWKFHC